MAANGGIGYTPSNKRRRQGIGQGFNPQLGKQLSHRVATGAITPQQAQHTAYQRQVLEQAFGQNWRQKVYGKGGAQGITGPFATDVIRQKRAKALERARRKVGALQGGPAAPGTPNPQGPTLY